MAAIYGVISDSTPFDPARLAARIEAQMAYRAPDGFHRWSADGCLLGHGALHLGQPAPVAQPLRLADGRICVCDAYIANHDQVHRDLGIEADQSLDDAQLVALALEQWGPAFIDRLRGEFAIAVWDPSSRSLQLYRDQLGARPLYWAQASGLFAFASAPPALVLLPGLTARFNPLFAAAQWYDDAIYMDTTSTSFMGIQALQPGHRMNRNGASVPRIERYWSPRIQEPQRFADEGEVVAAFREVFSGAVSRAMRGSSDAALMLSGGIDSAAILAARKGFERGGQADELLCVSAILDPSITEPGSRTESNNIQSMTRDLRRTLQFNVPVADAPDSLVTAADLAEVAWMWMNPADLTLLVPSLASRLARKAGCRLVFNGFDGDNVTSAGQYYMTALIRQGQLGRAWRESVRASRVNTYLQGSSPLRTFLHASGQVLEPAPVRKMRRRSQIDRIISAIDRHPMLAPGVAERIELPERLRRAVDRRLDTSPEHAAAHQAYWLGYSMGGSEAITARHGLESRHPWCDLEVVEFFNSLPPEYLVRGGWTKWVVRAACEQALGADVVWHSGKRHLGSGLAAQALSHAAPYLAQLLADQRPVLQRYVRDEAITDAARQLAETPLSTSQECDSVLTIVALAGWLRHVEHMSQL